MYETMSLSHGVVNTGSVPTRAEIQNTSSASVELKWKEWEKFYGTCIESGTRFIYKLVVWKEIQFADSLSFIRREFRVSNEWSRTRLK